jgi:hypothetical protein
MNGLGLRHPALAISPAVVLAASLAVCRAANFYVATNGNDSNLGTISQPFASLTKARDAARLLGTNAIRNIFIRGGEYFNTAVVLQRQAGADDSGLTIQGYPGEKAVLYGGMLITNWTSVSNGWYAAPLPAYPAALVSAASALTDWQVRMLLVDGQMAQRACYPTNTHSLFYTDTGGTNVLHYRTNDLGAWLVLTNAEIQIDFSWDQQTTGASAIDTVSNAVTLSPPICNEPGLDYTGIQSYRVYNIAQGMSSPGQFFYDRGSRSIVYFPIAGKDPNTSECIVPTTTRVIFINGTWNGPRYRPWGITLSNLTIAVATMDLKPEGFNGASLDLYSCLINGLNCDNLTMDSLTLGWTATTAVGMDWSPCTNTILRNSEIFNCGENGGAFWWGPCVISNNFIHSVANICYQSAGLMLYGAGPPIVTHNNIFDCKLSAITGLNLPGASITGNSISNCMQVLRDCGAIYTANCTNLVIAGNLIQHVVGYADNGSIPLDWFRHAIYCDHNTSGYLIYNNVTWDVPRPLMLDWCYNHVITNNFFVDTSDIVRLQFMNTLSNSIVFARNVCYSPTNLYVEFMQGFPNDVNNSGAVPDWGSDIFYSAIGGASGLTGIPANAVKLDPQFSSLSPLSLSFQPGSPALALGIVPPGIQRVGVRARLDAASNLRVLSH